MARVVAYNAGNSYLLPQAYPEGAPLHPSYPSGHATLAGARVTILKAFFDETLEFGPPTGQACYLYTTCTPPRDGTGEFT